VDRLKTLIGRIPVAVRAIVVGFAIQIIGVMPFLLLTQVNLERGRSVPWAALIEVGILVALVRYLSGRGWPTSTSELRRQSLRAHGIPAHLLPATIVSGTVYAVLIGCLVVLSQLWSPMPPEGAATILEVARAPTAMALGTLLMVALSAGVVEEAAFRGYMQVPIERRHGPLIAIVVVAVVFALSHSPPGPILPIFVLGATGWGVLARLTGSTLPGMFFHFLVDGVFLLWIWLDPDRVEAFLVAGADGAYESGWQATVGLVTLGAAIATAVAFVWLYRTARRHRA
jgi:membrane protease YdiL (CAAX protease family)